MHPSGTPATDTEIIPNGGNDPYLTEQLITYIGNKRALLDFIGTGITQVSKRLGKQKLDIFDAFSGSGVVARYFKQYASRLVVNDLEPYAETINRCYLSNRSSLDLRQLRATHAALQYRLSTEPLQDGFIREMYAPRNDQSIAAGERVFYTVRNARYLDTARHYISELPLAIQPYFLAPLLSEASIHANTSGVFKGFYKNTHTGIGQFGGTNQDALYRITGDIDLPFPLFSPHECEVEIHRGDATEVSKNLREVDVAYLDPPYNQHPYGSNYFMLNLLAEYRRPEKVSDVSGIPTDWNRSAYNRSKFAADALSALVATIPAKFLLISFNSEGFIQREDMLELLGRQGRITVVETRYNTFKASRNLHKRQIHVKEYLYLLERNQ